jgi:hypothetical protein
VGADDGHQHGAYHPGCKTGVLEGVGHCQNTGAQGRLQQVGESIAVPATRERLEYWVSRDAFSRWVRVSQSLQHERFRVLGLQGRFQQVRESIAVPATQRIGTRKGALRGGRRKVGPQREEATGGRRKVGPQREEGTGRRKMGPWDFHSGLFNAMSGINASDRGTTNELQNNLQGSGRGQSKCCG